MKKTFKKALALCLMLCMVLPLFAVPMSATVQAGSYTNESGKTLNWIFDDATGVFTIDVAEDVGTAGTDQLHSHIEFDASITKIIVGEGVQLGWRAFGNLKNLETVTIPQSLTSLNTLAFGASSATNGSLVEIVVRGFAYIPGAIDFSGITSTSNNLSKKGGILRGADSTILILSDIYSDELPLDGQKETTSTTLLTDATSIATIMGPYDSAYLRSYCTTNSDGKTLTFIPYGKTNDVSSAWTYDETTQTVTLYGDGTGSAINGFKAEDIAFLNGSDTTYTVEPAKHLIIRSDINSIDATAFAGLTSLETVTFEGDAPAVTNESDKFFGADVAVTVSPVAKGFNGTWNGYTVDTGDEVLSGTFAAVSATYRKGAWEFDGANDTLYIYSNTVDETATADRVSIPNLAKDEAFKAFAEKYGSYVKTVKLYSKENTKTPTIYDDTNSGFDQLADIGLKDIEKIYIGSNTPTFYKFGDMFKGLDQLTTFGREGVTAEGTVDLSLCFMQAGTSRNAFSGQDGIKRVIMPAGDTWSWGIDNKNGETWANIGNGLFAGMTGLEEVILSADTRFENTEGKGAYFRGTCMIGANAFDGCTSLKSITIPATAPASTVFRKSNNTGEFSVNLFNADTFTGSSIEKLYIWCSDASVTAEYNIPGVAGMEIICANNNVAESIAEDNSVSTVSCILEGAGVTVRYEKYNGLRNLYNFDNAVNASMSGYTLVEYGAMLISANKLGENELTVNPKTLAAVIAGTEKRAVWNKDDTTNSGWVGKVLDYKPDADTEFAITLANYIEYWDYAVYSRAYAVYEDASGNRFVAYADNSAPISFYDTMISGGQQGVLSDLVCDDIAVWNVLKQGIVGDEASGTNVTAMVVDGQDAAADEKVLVVRRNDGATVTADDITEAKGLFSTAALSENVITMKYAVAAE